MFCPKCGSQADDNADFCAKCGNDLRAARAAHDAADPEPAGADAPAPLREPEPPTAPMPAAETVPMAAAADVEAQAEYRAQMEQYERDLAAWKAQHGGGSGAGAAAAPTVAVDDSAPPAKKSRAALIVVIVLALLLLLLCGFLAMAGSIGFVRYSNDKVSRAMDPTAGLNSLLQAQDDTSSVAPTTPERAVDAFYLAISNGELSTLRSLSTTAFAATIDSGMFEGRDPNINYRVVAVRSSREQATVDVAESSGDAPAQTGMTFKLTKQPDGTWLVAGFEAAVLQAPPGGKTTPLRPVLTKDKAVDVVSYLDAQKNGDIATMRALATDHMRSVHAEQFQGSAKEAFISFEVTKAAQKPDKTWVITTKESWISGMETPSYYVVMQNGKPLVNDQTWPQ